MKYTFKIVELKEKLIRSRKLFILIISFYITLQFFDSFNNSAFFKDFYYYIFVILLLLYIIFIVTEKKYKIKGQIVFKEEEILYNNLHISLTTIKNINFFYKGYKGEIKSHSLLSMIIGYEGVNNFIILELEEEKYKLNFFSDSKFDIKKIQQIIDHYKNKVPIKLNH